MPITRLAIDERRGNFEPTLWKSSGSKSKNFEQVLEQRWFAGVHSMLEVDIRTKASRTSRSSGSWRRQRIQDSPSNKTGETCAIREAMDVGRLACPLVLQTKCSKTRDIPSLADIDPSVHERMKEDPTYRPENVLKLMRGEVVSDKVK